MTDPKGERLQGRRIVVTGAASGMGAGIARLFSAEGASLALLDISREALAAVAAENGQHAIACDVSDEGAVNAAIADAFDRMGGIDGVVNVAGILVRKAVRDTTATDFARVVGVNLAGPFNVCRAALPYLEAEDWGTIVNVASLAGLRSQPGMALYSATKAGLVAFTEALSGELGPTVRANCVCPGVVQTPMIDFMFENSGASGVESLNRAGRPGTPEDIAKACLYLSTQESSFVSAASLAVTGGHFR